MPNPNIRRADTQAKSAPTEKLWTVMYAQDGELKPLNPAYTAMQFADTKGLLAQLKDRFPRTHFVLTEAKADHLTPGQARKAMKDLFTRADRPDLAAVAAKSARRDVQLLAPIGFAAERRKQQAERLAKLNDERKLKGLNPLPGLPPAGNEPQVRLSRSGNVVIHLGGAR